MAEKEHFWEKLETHQLENIFHEDDVPLLPIARQTLHRITRLSLVLFVMVFASGFFIVIPREVNLDFELRGGGKETIWQYPEAILIRQHHVRTGEVIEKGNPLLTITSPAIATAINRYHNASKQSTIFQTHTIARLQSEQRAREIRLGILKGQIRQLQQELKMLGELQLVTADELEQSVSIFTIQLERDEQLLASEAISQKDLEASQQNLRAAKVALSQQQISYAYQVSALNSELRGAIAQEALIKTEATTARAIQEEEWAIRNQAIDLALSQLELTYGPGEISKEGYTLFAPAGGQVTLLNTKETTLENGELIGRVLTDTNDHYAFSEADPLQTGSLIDGQRVILKYASFPHFYYGSMEAEITSVSKTADPNGLFPIRIAITDAGRLKGKVVRGMKGRASVVVEEHTVMQYLFKKLLGAFYIDE
jgi:hypothetical protein